VQRENRALSTKYSRPGHLLQTTFRAVHFRRGAQEAGIDQSTPSGQSGHESVSFVKRAIVLVDHGSRQEPANTVVKQLAQAVQQRAGARATVSWAHLEAAEPSLPQAIAACVSQGAREVTVQPMFLVPGRHATRDIPALLEAARQCYPGVTFVMGQVIGADPLLAELLAQRCGLG
jgi:sirohydrochlorin ferrochelatase